MAWLRHEPAYCSSFCCRSWEVKLLVYVNFQPWMQSAHQLLDFLVSREDATPFRHPVDLNDFPVSLHVNGRGFPTATGSCTYLDSSLWPLQKDSVGGVGRDILKQSDFTVWKIIIPISPLWSNQPTNKNVIRSFWIQYMFLSDHLFSKTEAANLTRAANFIFASIFNLSK